MIIDHWVSVLEKKKKMLLKNSEPSLPVLDKSDLNQENRQEN